MATAEEIAREKYISLTTFRRTGEPVATPVWVAQIGDGRVGLTTSATSGKVKRLNHDPAVLVQPCDARGRLTSGTQVTKGLAEVVRSGPAYEELHAAVRTKYGVRGHLVRLVLRVVARLRGAQATEPDAVVLVRVDDGRP